MKNKVELIGRLGLDPEVKILTSGNKVVRISLATSEVWKDKEGVRQEKTQWHNISFFGKLADNAERLMQKGTLLAVDGKLEYRMVEANGEKKYYTDIVPVAFQLLADGKKNENYVAQPQGNVETAQVQTQTFQQPVAGVAQVQQVQQPQATTVVQPQVQQQYTPPTQVIGTDEDLPF